MNPFKLTDSPSSTPSARIPIVAASSSSSREDDSRGGWHEESAPHSSRRPSSLLALAIMRNYGAGKSSGSQLYNGLGGHAPSSLAFSSSSRPPLLAQQCPPRVQPKKTSKHKPAKATTAHHSVPLDAFLRK
ncbi:unnamed protein product [Dibothriocephalus latus]|uniref:Uncharacterized protein n=1 Tax=Dibothriocephalus latus TaxID=60516 RepID=A0A3P6QXA3_DIBLA|nr:unnamed protein product [Dibothriocephalus latus]